MGVRRASCSLARLSSFSSSPVIELPDCFRAARRIRNSAARVGPVDLVERADLAGPQTRAVQVGSVSIATVGTPSHAAFCAIPKRPLRAGRRSRRTRRPCARRLPRHSTSPSPSPSPRPRLRLRLRPWHCRRLWICAAPGCPVACLAVSRRPLDPGCDTTDTTDTTASSSRLIGLPPPPRALRYTSLRSCHFGLLPSVRVSPPPLPSLLPLPPPPPSLHAHHASPSPTRSSHLQRALYLSP